MKAKLVFSICILFPLLISSIICADQKITLGTEIHDFDISIDMPLETVISRRMSIRQLDLETTVPLELVSKVLWGAYGYSWRGRTVPSFSDYPLIIYISDETATYKFVAENQSLVIWKNGDLRKLGGGYDAPIQLYIVLDLNISPDIAWGNAEAGSMIQNIYLMANGLNLGTVCQYVRRDIPEGLDLPTNEYILYKMPLGYPASPYINYQNLIPAFRQSSIQLPEIQDSNMSFDDALNLVIPSHEWSLNPVTKQELSQVLWASYGFSYYEDSSEVPPEKHRTVPSAHAYYPMKIYAANSSGVYEYLPEQHTLTTIMAGDRRSNIAQVSGNGWAASSPLIIALAYIEDSRPYIGSQETYVEIGLITQNVFLESTAWGLIADWGKADKNEDAMRQALGLNEETNLHPVAIITIGHPLTYLHKVEWDEKVYAIETTTNSTILDFKFDQSNRRISFNVSGPSEMHGFCNVTIPNSLLRGDFSVLINGNPQTTLTQNNNSTHTSLSFTYELLGNLNVQITGEYVIPEFPTWTSTLILLALMAILFIYKHKKCSNIIPAQEKSENVKMKQIANASI
jgi:SagB-type dehydrogenase family enzyme